MYAEGNIVGCSHGKEKNRLMVIICIKEDFVYICDGKRRKIQNPKKKRIKHIFETNHNLDIQQANTDKKIRRILSEFNN